jgi:hypothetical protein
LVLNFEANPRLRLFAPWLNFYPLAIIHTHESLETICFSRCAGNLATVSLGDLRHLKATSQRDVLAGVDGFEHCRGRYGSIFGLFVRHITQSICGGKLYLVLPDTFGVVMVPHFERLARTKPRHTYSNWDFFTDCQEHLWCC